MISLFIETLNMSLSASFVAAIVMLIRIMIRKAPKKYAFALWAVVFFRLICPITIQLPVSTVPVQPQAIPHNIIYSESPSIQSGVSVVDNAMNTAIERALPPVNAATSINPIHVALQIGAYLWLTGVFVFLIYGFISYARLKKRVAIAIRIRDNIYETDIIKTPFVLGFIRPKIYIPTGLDDNQHDYIIKHEQMHIKRFDYLTKPLAFLITTIHWFNPIAWCSYALMARDMELSTDESVMKHSNCDIRCDYSNSLLVLSVKRSGLLSPLAFGETGVKQRVKNVLKYKKPAFWVSIASFIIVVVAIISLISSKQPSPPDNNNVAEIITTEADSSTTETESTATSDTTATTLPTTTVAPTTEATPTMFKWPKSGFTKAKITLLHSKEGYNWSTEFEDSGIVQYIHSSLTNDKVPMDKFDPRNRNFNEYSIELFNNNGGYSISLYHDIENSKAYVIMDGGASEIWCEFARNIDSFLWDANKGYGGKAAAAALFKQYGWTIGYDIAAWPYYITGTQQKLPSFDSMTSFIPNVYYFAYNNELSKEIGLDMSKYAGSEVTVEIYRLLERMPDEFYPTESCRGIVVWKDSEIIGAFVSAGRHSAFNACSLNGYSIEGVTGKTIDEWLEEKIVADEAEAELSKLQPEQIIETYFDAMDKGDYNAAIRCVSRKTLISSLTTNMSDNRLFNQSIYLPLNGEWYMDKGYAMLSDNLISAELHSVEPLGASRFSVKADLQYLDEAHTTNISGKQQWDCTMVYESPQTGWKIIGFGR